MKRMSKCNLIAWQSWNLFRLFGFHADVCAKAQFWVLLVERWIYPLLYNRLVGINYTRPQLIPSNTDILLNEGDIFLYSPSSSNLAAHCWPSRNIRHCDRHLRPIELLNEYQDRRRGHTPMHAFGERVFSVGVCTTLAVHKLQLRLQ
jgi:hypothetical protein